MWRQSVLFLFLISSTRACMRTVVTTTEAPPITMPATTTAPVITTTPDPETTPVPAMPCTTCAATAVTLTPGNTAPMGDTPGTTTPTASAVTSENGCNVMSVTCAVPGGAADGMALMEFNGDGTAGPAGPGTTVNNKLTCSADGKWLVGTTPVTSVQCSYILPMAPCRECLAGDITLTAANTEPKCEGEDLLPGENTPTASEITTVNGCSQMTVTCTPPPGNQPADATMDINMQQTVGIMENSLSTTLTCSGTGMWQYMTTAATSVQCLYRRHCQTCKPPPIDQTTYPPLNGDAGRKPAVSTVPTLGTDCSKVTVTCVPNPGGYSILEAQGGIELAQALPGTATITLEYDEGLQAWVFMKGTALPLTIQNIMCFYG